MVVAKAVEDVKGVAVALAPGQPSVERGSKGVGGAYKKFPITIHKLRATPQRNPEMAL